MWTYAVIGFALFIFFSIGLNLGLHGAITLRARSSEHGNFVGRTNRDMPKALERHAVRRAAIYKGGKKLVAEESGRDMAQRRAGQAAAYALVATAKPTAAPTRAPVPVSTPRPTPLTITGVGSARLAVDKLHVEPDYVSKSEESERGFKDLPGRDDISAYIAAGKKLPVILLTCNRPTLLRQTLRSLFQVRGVSKSNVMVFQDGMNQQVAEAVRDHGINLFQNNPTTNPEYARTEDGAARIAMHYKFSLTKAFDLFRGAPALIVVEDDLLFAPDFLEYFEQVGPLLDVDPSLFLISAWNDNGFTEHIDDPYALMRTEFFPGLGWLLPRKLYKSELESKWPNSHWDHWLRSQQTHQGREIAYPQVPRTYHNGIRGTFMNLETHNRYFKDIGVNQNDEVSWHRTLEPISLGQAGLEPTENVGELARRQKEMNEVKKLLRKYVAPASKHLSVYTHGFLPVYEKRIELLIKHCIHTKPQQLASLPVGSIVCLWINIDPRPNPWGGPAAFEPVSRRFHIWHEHARGAHRGLHEFYHQKKYILILNVFSNGPVGFYAKLKPSSAPVANERDF